MYYFTVFICWLDLFIKFNFPKEFILPFSINAARAVPKCIKIIRLNVHISEQ